MKAKFLPLLLLAILLIKCKLDKFQRLAIYKFYL